MSHPTDPKYDPPKEDHDKNNLQAQLEAQAQAQGELQGQLQGQGQGEYQGQSQHQSSENCNVNGNVNYDANANDNANCNINANYNVSSTTVCVDVKVSDQICESPQQAAIDMSQLSICMPDNDGIVNLMPENIYQTIDGSGSNANNVVFNLDQVNNLVSNGDVSCVSNGDGANVFGLKGGDTVGIGNGDDHWGGSVGSHNGDGAAFTQSLDSAGSVDAIGQSIVLGANVQLNNLTFTGHDSVVADHGSTADHTG
ncbi:MAG TPA: hypothetical protein VFP60_10140 [Pseudolabrys sp.]|nr:hypothetical protein [Pseudolabrys sp.]